MNFDLKNEDPAGRKAFWTVPTIPSLGRLELVYAGQSNKGYTNALAKLTAKTGMARRMARGQVSADMLEQNLGFDQTLFPVHVITGWDGGEPGTKFRDTDGAEVDYSTENVRAFVNALPPHLMQELSQYASAPGHFLPDDEPTESDYEETARD